MKHLIWLLLLLPILSGCSNPLGDKGANHNTHIDDNFYDISPVTLDNTLTVLEDTEINVDLKYKATTQAQQCELKDLNKIIQNAPCVCVTGNCSVKVQGELNYNGYGSFSYRLKNQTSWSKWSNIQIYITPVNDAPVSTNVLKNVDENSSVSGSLNATDVDSTSLDYVIVSQPSHGTLSSGTNGLFVYTPDNNYFGSDSFTYKANDGELDSNISSVLLTVGHINQSPVSLNMGFIIDEDSIYSGNMLGTDVDNTTLTYSVISQPIHGILTFNATTGSFSYNPSSNYNGPDSFTYQVSDGSLNSGISTVSITVSPVNDDPVASNLSVSGSEDLTIAIDLIGSDPEGDPLTYSIVSNPHHGVLSGSGHSLVYTPASNYYGSDSFTYKVNDGTIDSNIATVSISLASVNDAPVSNSSTIALDEDTTKSFVLSATDVENDPLTYSIINPPTHGTLSGTAPNLVYTPVHDYNGSDSFTFKVNDGSLDSNISMVTITVAAVNDAPVATALSITTNEDVSKTLSLYATDVDGDSLTYSVVTPPNHGTLSGTPPSLTYTPNLNYNGSDSFTYKANDGTVDSSAVLVSIVITPVNDAPTTSPILVSTNEDTAKSISLLGVDVDGDTLTYSIVSSPAHGSISGTLPNIVYTPIANYNGSDTFSYKVNDGSVDSNTSTVSITVIAVNDAPVASGAIVSTNEDIAKSITLSAIDVDGDTLSYSVVSGPTHGSLSGSGQTLTYTPTHDYNGPDAFTFKANDGTVDSNVATISITVIPVNDAPVTGGASISTNEDTAKAITLTGSDVDGDTLTYSVVVNPTHGSLSGTAPNLIYTPSANYNGPDSFTYKANDGTVDSNISTISITVIPVNDAPVTAPQSVTLNEDTSTVITLSGTDVDGDTLTYSVVASPSHGTLSGSGSSLTYTPAANYNGADSFTYKANDGTVNSNISTVSITVTPVNDAPTTTSMAVSTNEDTAKVITLNGSDIDGDTLTYSIVASPAHGTLSGSGQSVTYTPASNYNGADSFTFRVNDGTVNSNTSTVSITVIAVNDAPTTAPVFVVTNEDTAVGLTLLGSDVDGDALTYSVVASPSHGTLSGTGSALTYTPAANYNGSDSFTYKANDGTVDSNVSFVSITVISVNDAPVTTGSSVSTNEDTAKVITLNATDVDGDTLTYSIVSSPTHGVLTGTGSTRTYTPAADYNGSDSFTFKVNDGTVDSNTSTISITVVAVNDAPVTSAVSVTTNEDTPAAITLTGTDVDGDTLTYSIVSSPTHGTLTGTGANRTYTPATDYNGTDSFTYKVNDGTVDSNVSTVSITITPVNDAPTITSISNTTIKTDQSTALTFAIADIDSTVNCSSVTKSSSNTGVIAVADLVVTGSGGSCTLTVTPSLNVVGTSTITLSISDGSLSATTSFTLTTISVSSTVLTSYYSKISVDFSTQYDLVATYSDGSTANVNSKAAWSSNAPTVFAHQTSGLFKGTAAGAATVTATLKSISKTATMSVLTWTNLTLSQPYINAGIYSIIQQRANVTLSDSTFFEVTSKTTWTSNNTGIALIGADGKIELRSQGNTYITGTFGVQSINGVVNVLSATLTSITVNGAASISVPGSSQYTAIATYNDNSTMDVTNSVTWTSSSPAYGTVSDTDGSKGLVTAVAYGSTTITATMNGTSGYKNVNTNTPTLSSVAISPLNQLAVKGQTIVYSAIGTFSDGSTADISSKVTWASSVTTVASFSGPTASVIYSGTTLTNSTMSATLGSVSASTNLRVFNATYTSLYFNYSGTVAVGSSIPLKVYGISSDGASVDITSQVNLSSDATNILSVSNSPSTKGQAYGLSNGSANVTATYGGLTATQAFTVAATSSLTQKGDGLLGEYYSGTTLSTFIASRVDATVNFNWAAGAAPLGLSDAFSIRWSGFIKAQTTQSYYICTDSDDGIRVWVNGVQVINNFTTHSQARNCSATAISMTAGTKYSVTVEYFENTGSAVAKLFWGAATASVVTIPQDYLYSK